MLNLIMYLLFLFIYTAQLVFEINKWCFKVNVYMKTDISRLKKKLHKGVFVYYNIN